MDEEYEAELTERELPFFTTPLVLNGDNSGKPAGFIRYCLQVAKWDDMVANENIIKKFNESIATVQKVILIFYLN